MAYIGTSFSRTPRGFEAQPIDFRSLAALSFSRTPRGFEAVCPRTLGPTDVLSAEPLVGLKQIYIHTTLSVKRLSAEPLVGLKHLDHE